MKPVVIIQVLRGFKVSIIVAFVISLLIFICSSSLTNGKSKFDLDKISTATISLYLPDYADPTLSQYLD